VRLPRDAQLLHDGELQAVHDDYDAAQPRAHAWSAVGEAVFPSLERHLIARVLTALSNDEPHALIAAHHGYDVKLSQPHGLHVVTWSGFWQQLFYFSDRGHSGPMSFSSSRRLYRKKPDKLG